MKADFECSLLVPCYNAAPYLPRLLKCIENQSLPFKEVLFYDDGSSDATGQIIEESGYSVIRGAKRHGVSFARNRLLEAASCDWVHFHDADDLIESNFLAAMSEIAQDSQTIYLCQSDWIDADHGNIQLRWRYDQEALSLAPLIATLRKPVSTLNAIYPIEILKSIHGFDESVACWEDADLNVRLAEEGYLFCVLDQVLVKALRRTDSSSAKQSECEECRYKLLKEYKARMDPAVLPVLAAEFEHTARRALLHKNYELAKSAIQTCLDAGGDPPSTSHKLILLLKKIVSPYSLLRIQSIARNYL